MRKTPIKDRLIRPRDKIDNRWRFKKSDEAIE
jgi:hypothetical protein